MGVVHDIVTMEGWGVVKALAKKFKDMELEALKNQQGSLEMRGMEQLRVEAKLMAIDGLFHVIDSVVEEEQEEEESHRKHGGE